MPHMLLTPWPGVGVQVQYVVNVSSNRMGVEG
jgi:hypothetical protein